MERQQRRTNGVFYTPPRLSSRIADWAVRTAEDKVLDPAMGGGVFLHAAIERLAGVGSKTPLNQVFGVDVDPSAVVGPAGSLGLAPGNVRLVDFLSLRPQDFPAFDAIIGNPPWVRHHLVDKPRAMMAQEAVASRWPNLSRRSSYWAYFLLHAMDFLAPGGRLAFVLPWSFQQADYAGLVREAVASSFESVDESVLDEKLFAGTDERSIVLWADRFGGAHRSWNSMPIRRRTRDSEQVEVDSSVSLGDVAAVGIGLVTGASDYFLLSRDQCKKLGLSAEDTTTCLSRRRHLQFPVVDVLHIEWLAETGSRIQLLTPQTEVGDLLKDYLAVGTSLEINLRLKCRQRSPWYSVPVQEPPAAMMSFFGSAGPVIVKNAASVQCTNSLYRIDWEIDAPEDGVIWGLASTIGQLNSELVGRHMAGGALKLEPSDVRRLRVPVVDAGDLMDDGVDASPNRFRALADQALVDQGLIDRRELAAAARSLARLRELRGGSPA